MVPHTGLSPESEAISQVLIISENCASPLTSVNSNEEICHDLIVRNALIQCNDAYRRADTTHTASHISHLSLLIKARDIFMVFFMSVSVAGS